MENVYLTNNAVLALEGVKGDNNAPYSFREWAERRPFVEERDLVVHYSNYVTEWFKQRAVQSQSEDEFIRAKYLHLLADLQLFFSEEEKNNWYNQVDILDEKELLLAIPFFSRKLKEVSLYYLGLRKRLKTAKIRYNSVGTNTALEHEIYKKLLERFADDTDTWSILAKDTTIIGEQVEKNLIIKIEELYDEKQYLDRSTTVPASSDFDFNDVETERFFATKGLTLSSSSWLFNALNAEPTLDLQNFVSSVSSEFYDSTDFTTYFEFIQRYLAENKYTRIPFLLSAVPQTYSIEINEGSNSFYFPYGVTEKIGVQEQTIAPIALSSLEIEGANSGETINNADTMFVTVGGETKAAWLKYKKYDIKDVQMTAVLNGEGKTKFVFPYPGYGLSAVGMDWTGPAFETTNEYNFMPSIVKSAVDSTYWSNTVEANTCDSVALNNSTLVSSGATPNKNPKLSDQIFVRGRGDVDDYKMGAPSQAAWLCHFDRTCLPIQKGATVLYWPYTTIDTEANFPNTLQELNTKHVCDHTPIEKLTVPYATAAGDISNADKIYKLERYDDANSKATECAWLSGKSITSKNYKFFNSGGFNALFPIGAATRFIWSGPNTPANEVFRGILHDKDCPFFIGTATVGEPSKCTCKQVYYSPLGHPGSTFDTYNKTADCIIEDTENALTEFDISSWRDSDGDSIISNSKTLQFAWYQTVNKQGWGDGKWVTGNIPTNYEFILEYGKAYYYKRTNLAIYNDTFPPLVAMYTFNNLADKECVWIGAKKDAQGNWYSTDKKSAMSFAAGDLIRYQRQETSTFYLLSAEQLERQSNNLQNNIWASYDYVAVDSQRDSSTIIWPSPYENYKYNPREKYNEQIPDVLFKSISAVKEWQVTNLTTGETAIVTAQQTRPDYTVARSLKKSIANIDVTGDAATVVIPSMTFTPYEPGIYKIVLRLYQKTFSGPPAVIEVTNIPQITAVSQYYNNDIEVKSGTPNSSFALEQNLTGWNYNRSVPSPNAKGAKPYWAKLYTDKSEATKYSGVPAWGYTKQFVDNYVPVNFTEISDITLNHNDIIEYARKGHGFAWKQPIVFREGVDSTQWCTLSFDTNEPSNLSEFYRTTDVPNLNVYALDTPTDIILSNSVGGNAPLIEFYSQGTFTWNVTTQILEDTSPISEIAFQSKAPLINIPNRYYATVATVPVLEKLSTREDIGGYFLPQHLGASQLLNKNFTVQEKNSNLDVQTLTEDTNIRIGGVGPNDEVRESIYTWTENNEWMMEPPTAGALAGTPKKFLTKQLQTFIPYQANAENVGLGILNINSRFTPWGGPTQEDWRDTNNEPKSFTGVRNLSAWLDSQLLKRSDKTLEYWTTDIYGNQYGVFKNIDQVPVYLRKKSLGELWVRKNDQKVQEGHVALSDVFSPFSQTSYYHQLTGEGIRSVDCYFDTLAVETSSVLIFAELKYDYDTAQIETNFDDIRFVLLDTNTYRYDNCWVFTSEKKLMSMFTSLSAHTFVPELIEFDLKGKKQTTVFPSITEKASILQALSSIEVSELADGLITYSEDTKTYLLTYNGVTISNELFVINFAVKDRREMELDKIEIFTNVATKATNSNPPAVLKEYFTPRRVYKNAPFRITVEAENNPTSFVLLNYTSTVTVNASGKFAGALPLGTHNINYEVSNKYGATDYSLTVMSVDDVPSVLWSGFGELDPPVFDYTGTSHVFVSQGSLLVLDKPGVTSFTSTNNIATGKLELNGYLNLTNVNCSHNSITTIDVLSCNSLSSLNCSYNRSLSSIIISDDNSIAYIDCTYSNLSSADVDKVIIALDHNGIHGGTVLLYSDVEYSLSPEGQDAYDNLRGKNWRIELVRM